MDMDLNLIKGISRSEWFSEQVRKEAERDSLAFGDRVGEILAIVVSLVFIAFIAIHQTRPTGFFTDEYGTVGASVIYIVIIFGMIPLLVRLVAGRRNGARPLEAAGMGVFAAGSLYLLVVFPFDMTRLAQPLPHSLEFLLDWIPESLAKWVLAIGLIACVFFAPYTYLLHQHVKEYLSGDVGEERS